VCRCNLRGIGGGFCPERDARLGLRVGSIDLRLGPWLACLLAVALPAGHLEIFAAVGTRVSLRNPQAVGGWR
jgi:hypothetical protein